MVASYLHFSFIASKQCQAEVDDTIWQIEWRTTTAGSIATQNCPGFTELHGILLLLLLASNLLCYIPVQPLDTAFKMGNGTL